MKERVGDEQLIIIAVAVRHINDHIRFYSRFLGRSNKPLPSPPAKGSGVWVSVVSAGAQWGPRRSYGKMWFWCISGLEKSSNLDISQLVGRFQLLELCTKSLYNRFIVRRPLQHPINYPRADMPKNLYSDLRLHLGIDSVENSVAKRRNRFIKRHGETDNEMLR